MEKATDVRSYTLPADAEPRVVTGYMCLTDWDHEIGYASDGNKVYPSEAALRRERRCADECGVVEVTVTLSRVIQPSRMLARRPA
jgi:hypothetical protein